MSWHIANLTTQAPTPEQSAEGVSAPEPAVAAALAFDGLPNAVELRQRAVLLADMARARGAEAALIDGPGYLMSALERALQEAGIRAYYACHASTGARPGYRGLIPAGGR